MPHYSLRKLKKILSGRPQPEGFEEHMEQCGQCRQLFELAASSALGSERREHPQPLENAHLPFDLQMGLVAGEVPHRPRGQAIDHLVACQECRSDVSELAKAAREVEQGRQVEAAPSRIRKARELWRGAQPDDAARPSRHRVSAKNPMTICVVADDSKSMEGDPARELTESLRDFTVMLQAACGGRHSYFDFLVVKFGDYPRVLYDFTPVLDVDPGKIVFRGESGGTDMGAALELVYRKLSDPQRITPIAPPLILFCSDGSNSGADPMPWAKRIKELRSQSGDPALLVTCGFGEVDRALLEQIATSGDHYKDLRSPFELRQFLADIGSTVSSVATEGQQASSVAKRILAVIGKAA